MKYSWKINLILISALITSDLSFGQGSDSAMTSIYNMSLEELMNTKVAIATKSDQALSKSPSSVSVITAEEIKAYGFREIQELLEIIPSIEFSQIKAGAKGMGVRGVADIRQGGRILVMIDGTPYNGIMYGTALYYGGEFNMDNIEKVEVIRGPGSALYGRNAFSVVINIITKKATRNNQIEISSTGGSFNTADVNLIYGIRKEKFNALIATKYYTTDWTDSKFDNGMGGLNTWNLTHDNFYLNANMEYGNFSFVGSFTSRKDGNSSGMFMTDDLSVSKIGTYNLFYSKNLNSRVDFRIKMYGQNENREQNVELLKPNTSAKIPGTNFPFSMLYPAGLYAQPSFNSFIYGAESELKYKISEKDELLIGLQADIHGVDNAKVRTNYDLNSLSEAPPPLSVTINGQRVYITKDNMPYYPYGWIENNGHTYRNIALYVQNIFNIINNISITAGGRFDFDSETGFIFNPRAGVVYEPIKKTYLKLLYGEAYRAPVTNEQYKIMGLDKGNKNLKYEKIRTSEIAISSIFNKLYGQVSFFYNKLDNLILQQDIDTVTNIKSYYNNGKNTSYGVEFELKYLLNKNLHLFYNCNYIKSEDTKYVFGNKKISPHANISNFKSNFGLNTNLFKYLNYNILLQYHGPFSKYESNSITNKYVSQDEVGDYLLFNTSLRIVGLVKGLEVSFYGYNLLNSTYYFQDDRYAHQPSQPGRNFLVKALYNFNY